MPRPLGLVGEAPLAGPLRAYRAEGVGDQMGGSPGGQVHLLSRRAAEPVQGWLGDGLIAGWQTIPMPVETSNSMFRPKCATMGGCLSLESVREIF